MIPQKQGQTGSGAGDVIVSAIQSAVKEIIRLPHTEAMKPALVGCERRLVSLERHVRSVFSARKDDLPPPGDPKRSGWRKEFATSTAKLTDDFCGTRIERVVNDIVEDDVISEYAGMGNVVKPAVQRMAIVIAQVVRCQLQGIDHRELLEGS
jgi:hypothetical protein